MTSDNSNVRVYVNGAVDCTGGGCTATSGGVFDGSYQFQVGAYAAGAGGVVFSGNIDEVAVFSRNLSATEVLDIYNNGLKGNKGQSDFAFTQYLITTAAPLSYANMNTALTNVCARYSKNFVCTTFGTTAQGRNINGIIINPSNYLKTFLIDGGIHGNETLAQRAVLDLATYLVQNPFLYSRIRWILIGIDNPDGLEAVAGGRRKNCDGLGGTTCGDASNLGLDINRNFSVGWENALLPSEWSTDPADDKYAGTAANSGTETQVLKSIVDTYTPDWHFNVHDWDDAIYRPYLYAIAHSNSINTVLVANGFAALGVPTSLPYGTFFEYSHSVGAESYIYETHGTGTYTSESNWYMEVNRFICAVRAFIALQGDYEVTPSIYNLMNP
jgi:hypothetical protein